MMDIIKTVGGWLFGPSKGSIAQTAASIAQEYIEDPDKRNEIIGGAITTWLEAQNRATIPWVDALHKIGRQAFIFSLTWFYIYAKLHAIDINWQELLTVAGPGAGYILLKGRGN